MSENSRADRPPVEGDVQEEGRSGIRALPFHPDNIFIILVEPKHPGNIGAACRAMANMGLHKLRLVAPKKMDMTEAGWLAAGAQDVLAKMEVLSSLPEALEDIATVVGTTARPRHWSTPVMGPRALGSYLLPRAKQGKVAILFGREDFGLDNESAGFCELLIRIPTAELSSLNLAQAVLLVAYELMMAQYSDAGSGERRLSTTLERERLIQNLMRLSARVEYRKSRHVGELQAYFRGMAGRLFLDSTEVQVLMGLLRKTFYHLGIPMKSAEERRREKGRSS